MEMFQRKMVITTQSEDQPPQGRSDDTPAVDEFVPHQEAGVGTVTSQEQFDGHQVGQGVSKLRYASPAPLAAHLKQQPQIDHEQAGDGAHHRRRQRMGRFAHRTAGFPAEIIGQYR